MEGYLLSSDSFVETIYFMIYICAPNDKTPKSQGGTLSLGLKHECFFKKFRTKILPLHSVGIYQGHPDLSQCK